jgi:hypothetical protein
MENPNVRLPITWKPAFFTVFGRQMLQGSEKATLIVGHFGSGKSEVAVNLSLTLQALGQEVTLADIDLVNPYFRSREAIDLMEARGINVIVPPKGQRDADLPILMPQVRSLLMAGTSYGILDVGGDDAGGKVLGSMNDALAGGNFRVLLVVNSLRPFSDTPLGVIKIMEQIEVTARLKVTGLVSNAHIMEATDIETIMSGYQVTREVSRLTGLPLEFVTASKELAKDLETMVDVPVLLMERHLLPPWLNKTGENEEQKRQKPLFSL